MEISEELSRLSTTTALNPPNSSWRTVWLPMYPAPPVTNMLCAIIAEPEQWTETEKTLQIITIKKKNRSSNVTEKIGHFTEASTLPCNLKIWRIDRNTLHSATGQKSGEIWAVYFNLVSRGNRGITCWRFSKESGWKRLGEKTKRDLLLDDNEESLVLLVRKCRFNFQPLRLLVCFALTFIYWKDCLVRWFRWKYLSFIDSLLFIRNKLFTKQINSIYFIINYIWFY